MRSITPQQSATTTKPLQRQCLYAVFNTAQAAQQAQDALTSVGVLPQLFLGPHHRGIIARIERFMMHFGEDALGLHGYVTHTQQGHTVLAVASPNRLTAMQHFQTLAQYGAYDVAYFGRWTVEYVGPVETIPEV